MVSSRPGVRWILAVDPEASVQFEWGVLYWHSGTICQLCTMGCRGFGAFSGSEDP
jgi:hypothetical protein